ncbi:hypothetical protein GQ457_14G013100 [Hibiscus cannabinus]
MLNAYWRFEMVSYCWVLVWDKFEWISGYFGCEIDSVSFRVVKTVTRMGFRSGHFRSGKKGYRSFQVDLTFRLESGWVQVRFRSGSFQVGSVFRSGPFQVGSISGRVRFRSDNFRSGPKQIIDGLIRVRVDFKSGSFQVGFVSGRVRYRSSSFWVLNSY